MKNVSTMPDSENGALAAGEHYVPKPVPHEKRRRIIQLVLRSRGKMSLVRASLNACVEGLEFNGLVGDFGAGTTSIPGYRRLIGLSKTSQIVTLDVDFGKRPHVRANLEQNLPFGDCSFEHVLCFNVLEYLYHPGKLMVEIFRVLKRGGKAYFFVPFFTGVHAKSLDFLRFTGHALFRLLGESGFDKVEVVSVGFGPFTTSCNFLLYTPFPRLVSCIVLFFCSKLDLLLERRRGKDCPPLACSYPLGYFVTSVRER